MRFYFSFSAVWGDFFRGVLGDRDLLAKDSILVFNCEEIHVLPDGQAPNPTLVPYEVTWRNENHTPYNRGESCPIGHLEPIVREQWLVFHSILLQKKADKKLICGVQNWSGEQTQRLQAMGEKKGWRHARMQGQGWLLTRLWADKGNQCFMGARLFDPVRERALAAYWDGTGPDPDK